MSIYSAEGLLELGGLLPSFALPQAGNLTVLSVSSVKYDISQMKNKTEAMVSERKE